MKVPRIINGCWQLARDHRAEARAEEESLADLVRLADLGLTAFDCADIYTGVEERLGAFRRRWVEGGGDPAALRIHTKLVPDLDVLKTIDARYVERIVARSRERLGVERLDLVQLHWWDFEIPGWVETARWMAELQGRGWIDGLGVTNFDVEHLRQIVECGVEIVSNQVQYSLLDRRPERGMVDFCRGHGIVLLCYGALAGGFLSERWLGRSDPGVQPGNRSLVKYRLIIEEFGGWDAFQELLRVLEGISRKHGVSIANVAVRWVLDRPGVAAVILGAASAEHAASNLRCFGFALDGEDRRLIEAVLAAHPGPPGDVYSVERVLSGRHSAIMKMGLNRGDG